MNCNQVIYLELLFSTAWVVFLTCKEWVSNLSKMCYQNQNNYSCKILVKPLIIVSLFPCACFFSNQWKLSPTSLSTIDFLEMSPLL